MSAITITDAAHDYLADLLEKQNTPGNWHSHFHYPAGYELRRNLHCLLQAR